MKKSINTKILSVVLAIACLLTFSISVAVVNAVNRAESNSSATVQDGGANGLRGGRSPLL